MSFTHKNNASMVSRTDRTRSSAITASALSPLTGLQTTKPGVWSHSGWGEGDAVKQSRARALHCTIIVLALALCTQLSAAADTPDAQAKSATLPADARIQTLIDNVLTAANTAALDPAIAAARVEANRDAAEFTAQLLLRNTRMDNPAPLAETARVIESLRLTDQQMIVALAPLLDSSDSELAKRADDTLKQYEHAAADRAPDFSMHRALIAAALNSNKTAPIGLVRHMYQADPSAAIIALLRAHPDRTPEQMKPILWAEHVISDLLWRRQFGFVARDAVEPAAREQLELMSRDDRWYARLYAASIAQVHPELATPELAERLHHDEHELVREFAASIAAK